MESSCNCVADSHVATEAELLWSEHLRCCRPGAGPLCADIAYGSCSPWKSSLASFRTTPVRAISAPVSITRWNRQSEGVPVYRLHGNYFECVQAEKEDDTSFEARHLVWLLDQYRTLKQAARDSSLVQLFEKINYPRPMEIRAGTSNGWFALQIDQTEFGPLPENDRLLLAGKETVPDDPLQNLAGGVLDVAWMRLMQEFNTALIQYAPPHFKSITPSSLKILNRGSGFNARLHTAATQVVQHLTAERGKFPGIIVRLDMQSNGTWLHSVEFLNKFNP
jgi:hypothetical protein